MNIRRSAVLLVGLLIMAAMATPASAARAKTRLVSKTSAGTPADGNAFASSISGNGRYVAFASNAGNLPGNTGFDQVYLHDKKTKQTRLVSKTSSGETASNQSFDPSISSSGRFISFTSEADNLPGGGSHPMVYVHDKKTKKTHLVSKTSGGEPADGAGEDSAISGNGRYVAFETEASNLGAGTFQQVVVHDRKTKKTRIVSKTSEGTKGDGETFDSAISHDGRFIVMETEAPNLGGAIGDNAIAIHDRNTKKTRIVSKNSAGQPANDDSDDPNISPSGRFVVFNSDASNLGPADGTYEQVYLHDRKTKKTKLVSKTSGGDLGDDDSGDPGVTAAGRYVVFETFAPNLGGGMGTQVVVRDLKKKKTKLMSVGSDGLKADGFGEVHKGQRTITPDGAWVVFTAEGTNMPGGAGGYQLVYIRGPLVK